VTSGEERGRASRQQTAKSPSIPLYERGTKGGFVLPLLIDDALVHSEILEILIIERNDILRAGGLRNTGFPPTFER
jgi:hypothetical protein